MSTRLEEVSAVYESGAGHQQPSVGRSPTVMRNSWLVRSWLRGIHRTLTSAELHVNYLREDE